MLNKQRYCRWLSRLTLMALTAFFMATASSARAEGTVVWGLPAGASVLDPHVVCGWLGRGVTHQMFESFLDSDLSQSWDSGPAPLKPQLATSRDISEDGLVYTYHLREGVNFHDGTPFNADAVKVNFDRFMDTESEIYSELANAYFVFTGYASYIASYEVVDPVTFRVTLTEPNYQWERMGLEDCPTMHFISPAAIAEYGDEGLPLHPIGTGPFKFVEREEGVKIVLERNDDYWGEPAKSDSVIFVQLEDPATRLNAFRAGEINIVQEPPWDEIQSLEDEGFILTANENPPWLSYIIFNHKNPTMQDVRVREAINLAIDREGIVNEILQGTGVPAYEMLSRGTTAYRQGEATWGYDPERAKELLAEAGYPDGLTIDFDIAQYGYGELVEKWVQRDLKKVGINAEINKMEWLAYLDKWNAGMPDELEMNTIGWGQQTASWTGLVTRCDRFPWDGSNVGWYCNPAADELLTAALNEPDDEKAGELYRQANQIIMGEDWAFAPLYHYSNPIMVAPNVKGFVNSTANWWDLWLVEIEE